MNNLRQTDDGFGYHLEDGVMVMHNPGSGNLCNPGGLSAWIEAQNQNSPSAKKAARAADAKAARKQKAEDYRVLGPLYGSLAQLIRANRSAGSKAKAPAVPKRTARRRRRLKD